MSKEKIAKEKTELVTNPLLCLADKLGFDQQSLPILQQALTHPAWFEGSRNHASGDNQRLEFLGDAVIDLFIGAYLYARYPEATEGVLSKMRAAIVCEASLAEQARAIGVDAALRLGHGSESGGDRKRPSVQADAFEAVMGALYLVRGAEATREFLLACFALKMDQLTAADYEDKKSLLQETVQAKTPYGVTYKLLGASGPDHAPVFESGAFCGKLLLGTGSGHSKKESELAAAADALAQKEAWLNSIG